MKRILIYIILLSFTFTAQVSEDITLTVAKNVFKKYHKSHDRNNFKIKKYDIIKNEDSPLFYLYHLLMSI